MGNSAIEKQSAFVPVANALNVGSRLKIAEIKSRIHDSKVCDLGLKMVTTRKDTEGELLPLQVHIDLLKFYVNKVLPNARDMGEAKSDAAQSKWSDILAKEDKIVIVDPSKTEKSPQD